MDLVQLGGFISFIWFIGASFKRRVFFFCRIHVPDCIKDSIGSEDCDKVRLDGAAFWSSLYMSVILLHL